MSSRIYVGRLSYKANEDDIADFFRGFGRIREILLKNGYGFVEFDDHRDADDAVYELNGKELMGERISIEHARGRPRDTFRERDRGFSRRDRGGRRGGGGGRDKLSSRYGPPTRTDYRLIVENLSTRVSWQDLKDYMRQAGEVTYADAHKQVRGEGVVEFSSYRDMKKAFDRLDDTEINGKRIKLIDDSRRSSRRSRSRSRSRRRSRSRSHGHSRSRSRSRSRRRSRSKSRSRSHGRKSRSRSHSRKSRSRSHGHKSRSRSLSHSRGRGRGSKSRSRSRSRSRSPVKRSKSRSRSNSRGKSRSPSPKNHHDHHDSDRGMDMKE